MSQRFVQTQAVTLYSGISASATTAIITPYPRDIQTNAKLTFADFGTTPTFTVDPKIKDYEEICSFTGLIDNGDDTGTLTGLTRNLIGQYPYTTAGTGKQHGSSAVIVFSDNPQMWARLASLENDNTFSGVNTFSQSPIVPTPTTANQAANKSYIDDIAIAGAPNSSTTVKGIGKTSVAPVSPTDPIFVGDNDPRMLTQDENNAALGTAGTPSTTNRYVTNDDTTGTGLVQRASMLTPVASGQVSLTAGQAITALDTLSIVDYIQTDGGIKYDNGNTTFYSTATNQSLSFTVGNNTNRLLLVQVVTNTGTIPSSVTYNGVAMTLVRTETNSFNNTIYRIVAPATGSNSILVTSANIQVISAYSLYNVDQTTPVEVNSGNTTVFSGRVGSWSLQQSVTNLTRGACVIGFSQTYGGSGTYSSATGLDTPYYYYNGSIALTNQLLSSGGAANSGIQIGMTSPISNLQATNILLGNGWTGGGSTAGSIIVLSIKPATNISVGVIKTNSSTNSVNEPLIDFIGFANANTAIGGTCVVNTSGVVTGLSGLTAGKKYYLQNTDGTIGTTRGTYGKLVGVALSTTTLLIQADKTMGAQITKTANYTYTAECDGFVKFDVVSASGVTTLTTDGVVNTISSVGASGTMPMTVPVSRGKTYIVSTGGNNITFTPLA